MVDEYTTGDMFTLFVSFCAMGVLVYMMLDRCKGD